MPGYGSVDVEAQEMEGVTDEEDTHLKNSKKRGKGALSPGRRFRLQAWSGGEI